MVVCVAARVLTLRDSSEPPLKASLNRTLVLPVAGPALNERDSSVASMDSRELAA